VSQAGLTNTGNNIFLDDAIEPEWMDFGLILVDKRGKEL
jgi:hypothetical protein